jgi:hypothetical protein
MFVKIFLPGGLDKLARLVFEDFSGENAVIDSDSGATDRHLDSLCCPLTYNGTDGPGQRCRPASRTGDRRRGRLNARTGKYGGKLVASGIQRRRTEMNYEVVHSRNIHESVRLVKSKVRPECSCLHTPTAAIYSDTVC